MAGLLLANWDLVAVTVAVGLVIAVLSAVMARTVGSAQNLTNSLRDTAHLHPEVDTVTVRKAEDGSEALFALARNLREKGATTYAGQIARDAQAVRSLTSLHPSADPSPADGMGAKEHASEMASKPGFNG